MIRKYKGSCDNAVLELVKPKRDKAHNWYFDTWYSSPACMRNKTVYRTVKSIMKTMSTEVRHPRCVGSITKNFVYTTRLPARTRRPTTLTTEWVKFCYRFKNTACKYCCLYALHQWHSPILFADSRPHLHNPWTLPTKKEAVKYRRTSNIHATTPPNHAEQRGHRQKPQRSPMEPYYIQICLTMKKSLIQISRKTVTNTEWQYSIG